MGIKRFKHAKTLVVETSFDGVQDMDASQPMPLIATRDNWLLDRWVRRFWVGGGWRKKGSLYIKLNRAPSLKGTRTTEKGRKMLAEKLKACLRKELWFHGV